MTLWRKRLIIFGLKILGAIIIVLVIVLFLYYKFYFQKDNLIKYVPDNAIAYATFNVNNEFLNQPIIKSFFAKLQSDNNIKINPDSLNNLVNYNVSIALLPNGNKLLEPDYLVILSIKSQINNYNDFYKANSSNLNTAFFTNNRIDRHIFVISNSASVIEQVKKINSQQQGSLGDNVNIIVNLQNLNSTNGKIYVNLANILDQVDKIDNLYYKLALINLNSVNLDDLFLNLELDDNNEINIATNKKTFKISEKDVVIDKLPLNYQYSLVFNQTNKHINELLSNISQINPSLLQNIEFNKQLWQNIYDFNWEADILPFLASQGHLVVDQNNNWILGHDISDLSDIDAKISQLESLIVNYVAYNDPIEQEKQLPDYTYITQIVKNPDVEAVAEKISNVSIKTIRSGNLEYSYYINDGNLFLANSSVLLKNMINNTQVIEKPAVYSDNSLNFRSNIILNKNYLINLNSYFEFVNDILITENLDNQELSIIIQ